MTLGRTFELPTWLEGDRAKARRVAWLSIGLLTLGSIALALTMGQSEAMKTAWVTEVLSILPPIAFLVATRYEFKPPSERFPFGYLRALSISYLVAASSLTLIGLWLLIDALLKLVSQQRPPVGSMVIFGHQFWAGWAMIVVLAASMTVGIILGKLKEPLAERLHDKALKAEAEMNRDEWISEAAAIAGILLIGFGFWWGDAVAAAFISLEIVRDGWQSIRQVVADLMDEAPSAMGRHELESLPTKLRDTVNRIPWVEGAAVRLREQGRALTGDVFLVPRPGVQDLPRQLEAVTTELSKLDWRLHNLVIVPVPRLDSETPPQT
jgi:cation diffusion facilitator family transporter